MNRLEMEQALESCDFFKGMGKDEISKITELCQANTYESGEYVFRQGEMGEHLYIIAEGHIVLERAIALGAKEGSVSIGILGKGRVVGCWSGLLGEPHHHMSSAVCKKSTHVLVMRGSELRQMMLSNLQFGFSVLERLCISLRERIQGAYGAMEKI